MSRISKFLVIAAIFTTFCGLPAAGQKDAERDRFRVMSFNIRYNEPRDGINAWRQRKQKVADTIRFHKADLVGLQEALNDQLGDLATLLPNHSSCGVGRSDGKQEGEFSAILYSKGRFKLMECSTVWLSKTPETPGSKHWDAAYPRIVTWAKLKDRRSGNTFVHLNTHFDHVGQTARVESAKLILERIGKIANGLPAIVTGDLNVTEDNEAFRILVGGKGAEALIDARRASSNGHFGGDSTFSAFRELQPGRKIDYILVSDRVEVFEHGILSDRWNGLWASDHLAVLAEVRLR